MASGSDFPDTVDLTSPKNIVDQSTKDRTVVQEELERRLKCRVDREELVKKNILPDLMTSPKLFTQTQQLQRAKIADNLQKKLRNRADKSNLLQMNILPDLHNNIDPGLQAKQLQLRKSKLADSLNLKLASRPGPLELIKGGILEPRNPELVAAVESVPFETTSQGVSRPAIPEISLHSSTSDGRPLQRHSIAGPAPTTLRMDASPPKDVTSPLSESGRSPRKFSDSSLSPAHSPSELYDETRSPTKSPQNFTSSYPPLTLKGTAAAVMGNHIGKAPSPSQIRKKQKQQRYRKLRYHEYVPPSKTNSKGGKTTPKSTLKADTPYNLLLQQQQLFLQLQVLQQQYPNGVLMQKLPDLISTLEPGKKGRAAANPPCDVVKMAPGPSIPPVLQVEQPNKYNTSTVRLDELKVSDLKAACKELGMIVSGKKVELVERLLDNNKGVLPAIALPDAQARDTRRLTYSTSHTSSVESQVSATSVASPSSPSLSPIFQFPGENHGGNGLHQQQQLQMANGQIAAGAGPAIGRQDPVTSMSPLAAPQVFPASNLQAQFDEMVERQKRSYISQKGPKSLAPRPELNDMLAIKFPYPTAAAVDQQPRTSSSKGGTLPHRSDSKPQFSFADKQSRSLPSSPRPQSPVVDGATANLISDLMDDTPAPDIKQEGQLSCSSEGAAQTSSTSISNTFLVSSNVPVSVAVSNAAMHMQMQMAGSNSTSAQIGMGAVPPSHSGFYPPNKPMRPMRSSVPVSNMPHKVHPMNPPSYHSSSPMMQRSISLSAAPPMHHVGMGGGGPPRLMTSYSADVPDLLPSSGDMGGLVTSEDALTPMDMETEYKDQHLTDLFDILSGDGNNFNPHAQPHSLASHYSGGKLSCRQDSTQSDSIMFGGGVQFGNPHLGPQHKSGSDLCLLPLREAPKPIPIGNSSYTGNSNMMLVNELGWLDLDNSSAISLSPTMNAFTGLNHSNPGSLPHEQFHLNFLDDAQQMKSSNPTLNSLGSHPGGEMHSFLEPSIHHQSGLFPPDESALVAELGLSS